MKEVCKDEITVIWKITFIICRFRCGDTFLITLFRSRKILVKGHLVSMGSVNSTFNIHGSL